MNDRMWCVLCQAYRSDDHTHEAQSYKEHVVTSPDPKGFWCNACASNPCTGKCSQLCIHDIPMREYCDDCLMAQAEPMDFDLKFNHVGDLEIITDVEGLKRSLYKLLNLPYGERIPSPLLGYNAGVNAEQYLTDLVNNTMRFNKCGLDEALIKCASNDLNPKSVQMACLYLLSRITC
jgi:hypothetical protein